MNENFESAGERTFTEERGEQTRVPGENPPDNQPENPYHIIILEVKIHRPYQGSNPQPSHIGQNAPADLTRPLNYWLWLFRPDNASGVLQRGFNNNNEELE